MYNHHDILVTEILLKVALNTITLGPLIYTIFIYYSILKMPWTVQEI